jgi:hypothetical protein
MILQSNFVNLFNFHDSNFGVRSTMNTLTAHVALVSESSKVDFGQISEVAAALQKQVVRDFGPLWNIDATVNGFDKLESVPADYWPVVVKDDINAPGVGGYHIDKNGQPFALVHADSYWTLSSSHETIEMLVDPFGNRLVAGSPPPGAPAPISGFARVNYLVEVCDSCQSDEFSYNVNGITVSDFVTPHYFDADETGGFKYSFTGSIKSPHMVANDGYISFCNATDNHWYQLLVIDGKTTINDVGVVSLSSGKSLREIIDREARQNLKIKEDGPHISEPSRYGAARAQVLRQYIDTLL